MPNTRLAPTLAWIRDESNKVDCPDCGQPIGETCVASDGQPLGRAPAHTRRTQTAGVELPTVEHRELVGWPAHRSPEARLAAGREEYRASVARAQREQRLRELRIDRRQGDLTEAQRAELIDLDAQAAADTAAVAADTTQHDDDDRDLDWRRGPRGAGA
jgi:endogenous inhibitor of DNA gyrase (YacG/DUF329 family)